MEGTPIQFTQHGVPVFDERHVREWGKQLRLCVGRMAATAAQYREPEVVRYIIDAAFPEHSHAQQVAQAWRDRTATLTVEGLREAVLAAYRHMSPPTTYEDIQRFVITLRAAPTWAPIWEGAIGNLERMRSEMANPSHYTDSDLVRLFLSAMDPFTYTSVCQNVANMRSMAAVQAAASRAAAAAAGSGATSGASSPVVPTASMTAAPPGVAFNGLLTTTEDITLDELKRAFGAFLNLRHSGPTRENPAFYPYMPSATVPLAPTFSAPVVPSVLAPPQPLPSFALPSFVPPQLPPPRHPAASQAEVADLTKMFRDLTIAMQQYIQHQNVPKVPTVSTVFEVADVDAIDVSQVRCWYCMERGHHRANCDALQDDEVAGAEVVLNRRTKRIHWVRIGDNGRRGMGDEIPGDPIHGARKVVRDRMRQLGRPIDVVAPPPAVASHMYEVSALPLDGSTLIVFDDGDSSDASEADEAAGSSFPLLGVTPDVFSATFEADQDIGKLEVLDYLASLSIDPVGLSFRAADIVQGVLERRLLPKHVDSLMAKRARDLDVAWPPASGEESVVPKKVKGSSGGASFGPRSSVLPQPAAVAAPAAPDPSFTPAPRRTCPPVVAPHGLPVPGLPPDPAPPSSSRKKTKAQKEKTMEIDGEKKEKAKQIRVFPLAGGDEDYAKIFEQVLDGTLTLTLREVLAISPGVRTLAHKQLGGRMQAVTGPAPTVLESVAVVESKAPIECGFYGVVESIDRAVEVEAAVARAGVSSVFCMKQAAETTTMPSKSLPPGGSPVVSICPRAPTIVLGQGTTQLTVIDSLIDSGSQVSVVSDSIFDAIQDSCSTGSYPIRMRSVHGETRELTRLAAVPFDIQGVRGYLHCFIVPSQSDQRTPFRLLLGQNFIDYVHGQFIREGDTLWFQMTSPLNPGHRALVRTRGYKRVPSEVATEEAH
ncbi:hypothetical protein DFJ73DRAFT_869775 [Zopfochytrium polystomum]|nr:hypothetical protein DFJ73DRAFT_869775 [Zopfochytrium polystomum]